MSSQYYFIGLMSGTSLDAIDAVVVQLLPQHPKPLLLSTHSEPIPSSIKSSIRRLPHHRNGVHALGILNTTLGQYFAQAAQTVLEKSGLKAADITAIGSHGQTIYHQPHGDTPFTLQIGDPNIIAYQTKITTVADFRRKDLAAGGQGAPLAPLFHAHYLRSPIHHRAILNIGGIANLTFLPADSAVPVTGFDTGPGNTLIDNWIQTHKGKDYDHNGNWARSGSVDQSLLNTLLQDPYCSKKPPKSTGKEYFHRRWLDKVLSQQTQRLRPEDVQATLTAFTAASVAEALKSHTHKQPYQVLACGGGVHNRTLMGYLAEALTPLGHTLDTTQTHGIDPDWVEAIAFAWIAQQTLERKALPVSSITGAEEALILGGIYY